MKHFRRILVALDLGPAGDALTAGSRKALRRAAWLAKRVDGSLTLLHSGKRDEYWDAQAAAFVAGQGRDDERRQVLEQTRAELREQGIDADLIVSPDAAWLAVIRTVLRQQIDIVVASKRTAVHSDERKVGTVARKLLRKCPCAVWLEDARASGDPSLILAATDLGAVGDRVVKVAASVSHALGAELHVVHAFSISLEVQFEGAEARRAYETEQRIAARTQIERILAATPMSRAARLHVGVDSPTQAILAGVERLRPGLVVMGTVSRGGIPGVLIGNTAERLIDRIDCALLTLKPEDFVCPIQAD